MKHGILLIDKPAGWTSHDVVQKVRGLLHEPKIGHLGTLDPMATGLLVLFVGKKALKVLELFSQSEKEYEARIVCGAVSTTYDSEGAIEQIDPKKGWNPPSQSELATLLKSDRFLGTITQTPPKHSAVHIDGERAYDIIRKDPSAEIDMPERTVHISGLRLISYSYPDICLEVACSSGTYIRSLAHDMGDVLHCGAYLGGLKRTMVGSWALKNAVKVKKAAWGHVIPLKEVLSVFPKIELTEQQWHAIKNGQSIMLRAKEEPMIGWYDDLPVVLMERKDGKVKARKVL